MAAWASQGDVEEAVWSTRILDCATRWVARLRLTSLHTNCEPDATYEETEDCRHGVRPGKSAGPDGIPSDVILHMPALSSLMYLLFSLMLRYGVYPVSWGTALVRALLKPGKPKNATPAYVAFG